MFEQQIFVRAFRASSFSNKARKSSKLDISTTDYISGFIWAYITRIYKCHTGLKISALAKVIPKKMAAQNCILAVGRTVKNRFYMSPRVLI